MPKLAQRLYGLYEDGAILTNISDDIDILESLKTNTLDSIEELDPDLSFSFGIVKDSDLDYFDIIENDKDKNYGFSEVMPTEDNAYRITCWKYRLDKNLPYDDAVDELTNNPGVWEDCKNVNDALNYHTNWWNEEKISKNERIVGFNLSDELKDMLLKTGFTSDRIILAC